MAEETATEEKFEVPAKFEKLVGEIDKLSVLELSELVKVLEKHYGVSAAAPMAVAAAPAGGGEAAEAAEEKSAFTVVLASAGDQDPSVDVGPDSRFGGLSDGQLNDLLGEIDRLQAVPITEPEPVTITVDVKPTIPDGA